VNQTATSDKKNNWEKVYQAGYFTVHYIWQETQ